MPKISRNYSKTKPIKKVSRSDFIKEIGKIILTIIVTGSLGFVYGVIDNPKNRKTLRNIWNLYQEGRKYDREIEKYDREIEKYDREIEKYDREIEKSATIIEDKIKKRRIHQWQVEDIPYPIRKEFVELPILASRRAVAAVYDGFHSKKYQKISSECNAMYNMALQKIPKEDPLRIVLWIAHEISFLKYSFIRVKKPVATEKIQEIESVINKLFNAKNSKSKRFINYTRLGYISELLDFLRIVCKDSLTKCNYDFLYHSSRRFIQAVYNFDKNILQQSDNNHKSFFTVYIMVMKICLDKLALVSKSDPQREAIKTFVYDLMSYADLHAKLLNNEEALIKKHKKFKENTLTQLNS